MLEVVNLRSMFNSHGPAEGSIEAPLAVLAELQQKGLIRHIGLSNVTPAQIAEARRMVPVVCVQNLYNLAHRTDDALIVELARDGIAYVPFFPLGGFTPLQSAALSDAATRMGATPMQVALAWLLQRSPNILVIPGTSSLQHFRENVQASTLQIPREVLVNFDSINEPEKEFQNTHVGRYTELESKGPWNLCTFVVVLTSSKEGKCSAAPYGCFWLLPCLGLPWRTARSRL